MYKTVTLKDVADYSADKIAIEEVSLENFITTDNILQNKQGVEQAVNLPPQGGSLVKYEKGNILIANIRPYLKKIWYADRDGGASTDVLVIQVKKNYDSQFVYYALLRDDFFEHMMNGSKGTKMPRGDKNQIMDFLIPDLVKEKQIKIASLLSRLDKKVELNHKINQTLEHMAKTLYDYWFVQFDFPDANGKPYKSSGGKMVYSEALKREIPEGWEVGTLSNYIEIERGISYKSSEINNSGKPMVNLNSFYLDGSYKVDGVKYFSGNYNENKTVKNGELLIAVTDVTRNADIIGKAILLPNIFEDTVLFSMDVAKITPNDKLDVHYLNMLFNSQPYHDFIKQFASGTLVLHLDLRALDFYRFVIPQKYILEKFSKFKSNIEKRKSIIIKENQQLTALRDWLLPMLMNGQVTVTEARDMVEEVMVAEPSVGYGVKENQ